MSTLIQPQIRAIPQCLFAETAIRKTALRGSVCNLSSSKKGICWAGTELLGLKLSFLEGKNHPLKKDTCLIRAAKKVVSGRSLVLSSTLVAEEAQTEKAINLCKKISEWAKEKQTDKSHGILYFECSSDAYDSNVIHFWERYDSFKSMNDIHASPEYSVFLDEVRPLLSAPVALAAYEFKDGQIGCMLNPLGPKGEGGLDDATGQGGSGGGASYKQTSQSLKQGITESRDWGMEKALEISNARSAAAALAKGLKNIFGTKEST